MAFAQFLACTDRSADDACGLCSSCIRYQKLEHPDLQLIFPKNKTKKIDHKEYSSKDFLLDWRKAVIHNPYLSLNDWLRGLGIENKQGLINVFDSKEVIHNLSYKAFEAERRVVLIWLPELMNNEAANKILKVLEEPPEKTVFLLVAEDSENMLQTILSRVQTHRVERLSEDDMVKALVKISNMDEAESKRLAHMADGDLRLAHGLMEDREGITQVVRFFIEWMRACYADNIEAIRNLADTFHTMPREEKKDLLARSQGILRKVLMYGVLPDMAERLLPEELAFIQKFARFITVENGSQMMQELDRAHYHIERNGSAKIIFTDLSFLFSELLRAEAIK